MCFLGVCLYSLLDSISWTEGNIICQSLRVFEPVFIYSTQ